jgi:hypothetical protein
MIVPLVLLPERLSRGVAISVLPEGDVVGFLDRLVGRNVLVTREGCGDRLLFCAITFVDVGDADSCEAVGARDVESGVSAIVGVLVDGTIVGAFDVAAAVGVLVDSKTVGLSVVSANVGELDDPPSLGEVLGRIVGAKVVSAEGAIDGMSVNDDVVGYSVLIEPPCRSGKM